MPSSQRYLQRHQPGLPLTVCNQKGSLLLFQRGTETQPWSSLDLDGRTDDREGEAFDATLEAFEDRTRLDAKAILSRGLNTLIEDERIGLRLVINQTEAGDPFDPPRWSAQGIAIAPRPTLPESHSNTLWALAEQLPCEEQRIFVCDTEGHWQIETTRTEFEPIEEAPTAPEVPKDRFAIAARGLSTRAVSKPFAIPGTATGTRGEGLSVFQIR